MDWTKLVTPEVVVALLGAVSVLLTIVLAILIHIGALTKKDVATAVEMLDAGFEKFQKVGAEIEHVKSQITDKTGLTLPQVNKIAEVVKTETASGDSNRKKINRAARGILKSVLFGR